MAVPLPLAVAFTVALTRLSTVLLTLADAVLVASASAVATAEALPIRSTFADLVAVPSAALVALTTAFLVVFILTLIPSDSPSPYTSLTTFFVAILLAAEVCSARAVDRASAVALLVIRTLRVTVFVELLVAVALPAPVAVASAVWKAVAPAVWKAVAEAITGSMLAKIFTVAQASPVMDHSGLHVASCRAWPVRQWSSASHVTQVLGAELLKP